MKTVENCSKSLVLFGLWSLTFCMKINNFTNTIIYLSFHQRFFKWEMKFCSDRLVLFSLGLNNFFPNGNHINNIRQKLSSTVDRYQFQLEIIQFVKQIPEFYPPRIIIQSTN